MKRDIHDVARLFKIVKMEEAQKAADKRERKRLRKEAKAEAKAQGIPVQQAGDGTTADDEGESSSSESEDSDDDIQIINNTIVRSPRKDKAERPLNPLSVGKDEGSGDEVPTVASTRARTEVKPAGQQIFGSKERQQPARSIETARKPPPQSPAAPKVQVSVVIPVVPKPPTPVPRQNHASDIHRPPPREHVYQSAEKTTSRSPSPLMVASSTTRQNGPHKIKVQAPLDEADLAQQHRSTARHSSTSKFKDAATPVILDPDIEPRHVLTGVSGSDDGNPIKTTTRHTQTRSDFRARQDSSNTPSDSKASHIRFDDDPPHQPAIFQGGPGARLPSSPESASSVSLPKGQPQLYDKLNEGSDDAQPTSAVTPTHTPPKAAPIWVPPIVQVPGPVSEAEAEVDPNLALSAQLFPTPRKRSKESAELPEVPPRADSRSLRVSASGTGTSSGKSRRDSKRSDKGQSAPSNVVDLSKDDDEDDEDAPPNPVRSKGGPTPSSPRQTASSSADSTRRTSLRRSTTHQGNSKAIDIE